LLDNLASIIIEPAYKLLMGFTEPWWTEDFQATAGQSITDLPLRQCYYFGTDPHDSHSLFLASYNDMQTVQFWSVLEQDDVLFEPKATALVAQEHVDRFSSLQAPQVLVDEAMSQVRELHGPQPTPIPDPYITYYKDWSRDPFGGGYHAWKAGVSVKDVMPFMRCPIPGEAIHICGESYSDQQGWVEGALCEAEKMLRDHFALQWPSWLNSEYYLGW
jgi:monoamine oxidase